MFEKAEKSFFISSVTVLYSLELQIHIDVLYQFDIFFGDKILIKEVLRPSLVSLDLAKCLLTAKSLKSLLSDFPESFDQWLTPWK